MGRGKKDVRRGIEALLRQISRTPGWSYTVGAHSYKVRTPANIPLFMSKTPSDPRAIKNIQAQLRRHGLNC